jgi:hypothetical protein
MRKHLRHAFIPHEGNMYHAHVLRPHRTVFWSLASLAVKGILIAYAVLIPAEAFVVPDVLADLSRDVFSRMNDMRTTAGLSAFVSDDRLVGSAFGKSADMATDGYFAHTSPTGLGLAYWLKKERYPYTVAGENLAIGFNEATEVVSAWRASPSHYANIVDPEFVDAGVSAVGGVYNNIPIIFTTAHFGATRFEPSVYSIDNREKAIAGSVIHEPTVVSSSVPAIDINPASSGVFVDRDTDSVTFLATAEVQGEPESVVIRVGDETIPLSRVSPEGIYEGSLTVSSSLSGSHKPFTAPMLRVVDNQGFVVEEPVSMEGIVVPTPTMLDRYAAAQAFFGKKDMMFGIIRIMYMFGIAVFGLGLLFHIVYDMRRHVFHHVTVQTIGILFLLTALLVV